MHPLRSNRRSRPVFLAIAAVLLAPSLGAAQTGTPSAQEVEVRLGLTPEESAALLDSMAPTDAGPVYYQLFLQLHSELEAAFHYFQGESATAEQDAETAELVGITRERATEALVNAQPLIERLVWASNLEHCDFGVMYQDGWGALLPHLGKMRAASRILRADAWRQLESGDPDAAAARLAAIYNAARHVSRDRILISSLVGIAIAAHAHQLTEHMLEHGTLTDEGRDLIIAALERFEADDPFNTRECIKMEGAITIGWLAKEYGDKADAGALLLELSPDPELDPGHAANIRRLNGAAVVAEARRLTPFYEQALRLWDRPDAAERLDALSAMGEVGAYGELGRLFAPALGRAREGDAKGQAQLAETLTALQAYREPKSDAKASPASGD
ncbi:MAG TPA: hypothetical protein VFF69_02815 [Phycisphaerales bacterium]|nr:hypothetical protein [Phycisphaerales bacterium]